jgi:very-short-patch-repair endonuclease
MGASRFRIDMVAEHPTKPERYVLAIECDGATYHSSYTARDRDRLRQQQLENLGWRFHRIWVANLSTRSRVGCRSRINRRNAWQSNGGLRKLKWNRIMEKFQVQ